MDHIYEGLEPQAMTGEPYYGKLRCIACGLSVEREPPTYIEGAHEFLGFRFTGYGWEDVWTTARDGRDPVETRIMVSQYFDACQPAGDLYQAVDRFLASLGRGALGSPDMKDGRQYRRLLQDILVADIRLAHGAVDELRVTLGALPQGTGGPA